MSEQAQVVFRMPGSGQIQTLLLGEGKDLFVVQAFDRLLAPVSFRGSFQAITADAATAIIGAWTLPVAPEKPVPEPNQYIRLVEQGKQFIAEGEFDKVVLARQIRISSETPLSDLFAALEQAYPDAFVYALSMGAVVMVGASPETLLKFESGALSTEALGGTKTHGRYTEKEYQEHQQIVDYIVKGIAQLGYQYEIKPVQTRVAGKVEHLRSEIQIVSKGLNNDINLLKVLHPTSAVCGLPFESSMTFIKNNEGFDRNLYAGYLGVVNGNDSFRFFVNLRCANVFDGVYELVAGAGINHLSNAEDELEETNNKFKTIAQCLK